MKGGAEMNENQLSKRLATAASYINKGARLADIGSDHAYLPCHLAQKSRISFGIAGEVVMGPFASAKKQIQASQVEEVVEARLGDGLQVIEKTDQIDTITICGMGGDLIARILDDGSKKNKLDSVKRLILQPNNAELKLRRWLINHDYVIIDETILEENDKIYEILVAEPGVNPLSYSFEDYLFGRILRTEKSTIFVKKWKKELDKYDYILQRLAESNRDTRDKKSEVERMMMIIKEEIS